MKRKSGYTLLIILSALGIWFYISEKPVEWFFLLVGAILLIVVFFFTEKNPFDDLIKGQKFFITILTIVIFLIGLQLNTSPYYFLFVLLPVLFFITAWEEHLYDKETAKAVEKAFAEKRPEDIRQALELLAYKDRYERLKNGNLWYNELQKRAKE